jgi:hypothetical protein
VERKEGRKKEGADTVSSELERGESKADSGRKEGRNGHGEVRWDAIYIYWHLPLHDITPLPSAMFP